MTNRQSRTDILKKFHRCFLCLKTGHTLKTCSAKYICRKCNGKHHISICDKGENKNSHTCKMKVRIVLLLLSIRVKVFCYKLHEQIYLTLKLKVLLKPELSLKQEVSCVTSMKKSANI